MKKKQRLLLWLLTVILILPAPLTARADSGPKPSVVITAEGLEGRTCYGTLLSEDPYNGPPDLAAIQAPDRETPEDEDGFMTSEIGERYAFDSYYTMDLSGSGSGVSIPLTESYNYTKEIVSLIARILIMILLEAAPGPALRLPGETSAPSDHRHQCADPGDPQRRGEHSLVHPRNLLLHLHPRRADRHVHRAGAVLCFSAGRFQKAGRSGPHFRLRDPGQPAFPGRRHRHRRLRAGNLLTNIRAAFCPEQFLSRRSLKGPVPPA